MRDIEKLIESFKSIHPTVKVRQFKVLHRRADDDGLWFFEKPDSDLEVQIESSTGMCPFLIENNENDARLTTATVDQTIETLTLLLHLESLGGSL